MQKLDRYVRIAEATELLGITENTLRIWPDAGKVPSTRSPANGCRLFYKQSLNEFLKRMSKSVRTANRRC